MSKELELFIERDKEDLVSRSLYRQLRTSSGKVSSKMTIGGVRNCLVLAGNNSLSLAAHPNVANALSLAATDIGCAAGGSRLIAGNHQIHLLFENELANFLGYEASLLFTSGYMANMGVITSLMGKDDIVLSDASNHASIVDACRLSLAEKHVFPHISLSNDNNNNDKHLRNLLEKCREKSKNNKILIVVEGVNSMMGDITNLKKVVNLAKQYDAIVMCDDTHGIGILGENGRGVMELTLSNSDSNGVDILIGNLSKSFGCYGSFVACSNNLRNFFINRSRNFIFTCALPPPLVAAGRESLKIMIAEPWRRKNVLHLSSLLRNLFQKEGFDTGPSNSHIIPLIVGDNQTTMDLCEAALAKGIFAQGIRYPTVPIGRALLRFCPMSTMTEDDMLFIVETITSVCKAMGIYEKITSQTQRDKYNHNNNNNNDNVVQVKDIYVTQSSNLAKKSRL